MKIAMPIFQDRISPRFDFSPEMWIIEVEGEEVIRKETFSTLNLNPHQRMEQLTLNGVEKLICGGIDRFSVRELGGRGIEVIQDVIGEAEAVLDQFVKGLLRPGCRCERRQRRRCGWKTGFLLEKK